MMMSMAIAILLLGELGAYLLGALPTAYLLAKAIKGIDIREYGSGNVGATNVFRVVGKGAGITVLAIDLLKGTLAVVMLRSLVGWLLPGTEWPDTWPGDWTAWAYAIAALLAVIGHSKSVWLGFSGGKSAATGLGVLLALAWPVGIGVAAVFALLVALTRTVSVGSIGAALSVAVFMAFTHQPIPYLLLAIGGGLYVVIRHRSNIARLLAGTEPKTFGH